MGARHNELAPPLKEPCQHQRAALPRSQAATTMDPEDLATLAVGELHGAGMVAELRRVRWHCRPAMSRRQECSCWARTA